MVLHILERHPEFKAEWEKLAADENGKSLYLSAAENVFFRIKGLNNLVSKEKTANSAENERLGFVSDYARTNFYEDAAELAKEADVYLSFNPRLSEWLDTNPAIRGKIRLAEKYGLVPAELSEFARLRATERAVYPHRLAFEREKAAEFLDNTDSFFRSHPDSLYEAELRFMRAGMLKHFSS